MEQKGPYSYYFSRTIALHMCLGDGLPDSKQTRNHIEEKKSFLQNNSINIKRRPNYLRKRVRSKLNQFLGHFSVCFVSARYAFLHMVFSAHEILDRCSVKFTSDICDIQTKKGTQQIKWNPSRLATTHPPQPHSHRLWTSGEKGDNFVLNINWINNKPNNVLQ